MHFVHLSPEDIKKHPWLGVLIGLIGITLFTFVSYVAARDYINFSKQKSPELVDVEKVDANNMITRKWVTLTNFHLNCERLEKTRRTDPIEKLVASPVYDTYIPVTNSSGKALIIAIFHGDVSCSNFQNTPLTGILTTTQDYSYGVAFLSTRLSRTTTANLILRIDEGLGQSQIILAMGVLLDIVFLSFAVKSSRLWLKNWESKFE